MAKKVFIGVGHGGSDSGAVKYIAEKDYTLKTAFALTGYLSNYGIDYKLSRTQDVDTDMNSKVKMCNNYKPDLVIDIHFNAGGGTGFEVYRSVVGGTSKTLAENINSEVAKIFPSRGVKTRTLDNGRDYFAIIRETSAPSVLVEGGFVDTKKDADFIKANYKKLAKAYADGIAKTLKVNITTNTKILDNDGYMEGDNTIGSLALKELLLIAKELGISTKSMNENRTVGDGTLAAINYLLGKWGYKQNGIAGENFIKRLKAEITKKIKK